MSVAVRKIWDDNNNAEGRRPASLRVTLSNGQSYFLNEANNWSVVVEGLPAGIDYTWTEQSVVGYTRTSVTTVNGVTVFTNRYRPVVVPPPPGNEPGIPTTVFEDYDTPLGVEVIINHVGDCYE